MLNHIELFNILLCVFVFVYVFERCEAQSLKSKQAKPPEQPAPKNARLEK
jgi:hypothetical protein